LTKSIAEAFISEIVRAKYQRAQMLYFLAWLYPDLIKVGELVGLTALELTLRDRYGNTVKARGRADRRRNLLAHGDTLPCGGLLELVTDLIVYVYRE